jgi:iron complex transport system permease protein
MMPPSESPTTQKLYYQSILNRRRIWLSVIVVVTIILFIIGISVGAKSISITDLLQMLKGQGEEKDIQIILHLRLPRMIGALISGAALGLAGAVMQIVLRNPLGSPFTLGISNASAFGAALAYILLDAAFIKSLIDQSIPGSHFMVTLSAFFWAAVAAFFILFIARLKGATPENMILAGIIINTFFMALTAILQFLADDIQLGSIVFWTFGDLSKGNWDILWLQLLVIIPILLYFLRKGFIYNALNAGDDIASSLGVRVDKLRLYSILWSSLLTACVVSFYGIIAFVGLIIPHVVRILIGNDSRYLLMGSLVLGALFLLLCDLVSRSLFSPIVIPVGIITSIVGAPLFVLLLIKGTRRWSM